MIFTRLVLLALALSPSLLAGQAMDGRSDGWRFLTRATASDGSHESSPEGYKIRGGLTIEGAIARDLNDRFAFEVSLRTESREVDGPETLPEPRLGSLEVLASSVTLKWQPRGGTGEVFQPYVGGGGTVTYIWETSGPLDSTAPPIALDPVVQLGSHLMLTHTFLLTLDVKWHPLDVELEGLLLPTPVVDVDPLVVGAGFGFSF